MRNHRLDGRQVDRVDAACVFGIGIGRDGTKTELVDVCPRAHRRDPCERLLVGLADGRPRRALRGHVRQRGTFVQRQPAQAGAGELHDSVERELRPGVVQEDVEHHVLGRDVLLQFARQLETDRLRHLDVREACVDEVRIFRRPDAPSQGVVHTSHAGVRVGSLDEVARIDDVFARHLMTDAGGDSPVR